MGTQVSMFDPSQMPAHVQAFMEDPTNQNVQDKMSTPTLAVGGKVFTIIINGEKTLLTKKDADGDDVPRSVLPICVIDYAKARGRSYYEKTYDANNVSAPNCWSDDGKVPHASIEKPISKKCDGCPMAAKGSRISDNNRATSACTAHLMLAVVPAARLDFTPLRLKLAITSIWDKDTEGKEWMAYDQYISFLRSRGVKNTGAVITKIKFQQAATDGTPISYPKLLFKADGWFGAEQLATISDLGKLDEVKNLLNGSWTPAGGDGKPTSKTPEEDDDDKAGPTPTPAKPPAPAPAPVAKDEDDDDDGQVVIPPTTPSPAAAAAKPIRATPVVDKRAKAVAEAEARAALAKAQLAKAEAEAAAAAAADDDDDEGEKAPVEAVKTPAPKAEAKPAKNTKAPTPPAAAPVVPKGVEDLIGAWGND